MDTDYQFQVSFIFSHLLIFFSFLPLFISIVFFLLFIHLFMRFHVLVFVFGFIETKIVRFFILRSTKKLRTKSVNKNSSAVNLARKTDFQKGENALE